MKKARERFVFQIARVEKLITASNLQENQALWLFLHDLRTPIFMLEGLSKLYAGMHDKKRFSKLQERFKTMEDALGAADYYASFFKEFSNDAQVPAHVKAHFDAMTKEKLEDLNVLLKNDGWLNGKRLAKIRRQLKGIQWQKEEKEVKAMAKFYEREVDVIQSFVEDTNSVFDNVEEDVHELRRKLRWLSIYPQALRGLVHLQETKPVAKYLQKYQTKEIVNSPFNQLKVSPDNASFLTFSKSHFLSLSWMIAELGTIKDEGLKIKALKDALQATELLNDTAALEKTYKLLSKKYPSMEDLLQRASTVAGQFVDEKILTNLIIKTTSHA